MALTCPLRLIATRDDLLYPCVVNTGETRPDADVVILEEGGNFEPDLAPDEVAATLCEHAVANENSAL